MKNLNELFEQIDRINYPMTMKKINGEIQGLAFFPGGKGTFNNDDNISNKSVMVLGQDFDCEKNYIKTLKNGKEDIVKNPTWRNLLNLLKEVEILPENCFFTNSIMGIRKGEISTGKSPAFKDEKFIEECQKILLNQIELQKPKVIFILGKHVAEFIAPISKNLNDWSKLKNYKTIDDGNLQIKKSVVFSNGIKSNLVILTHPSFRPQNIHRRTFENSTGNMAEILMIKSIIS
ncbi:MAG: uracil-DNA glycosylase family protein [Bacteroidia bacterium]